MPNFFKRESKPNIDGHKICIKDIVVRENQVSDGSERKASRQGVRIQDDHRLARTQPTTHIPSLCSAPQGFVMVVPPTPVCLVCAFRASPQVSDEEIQRGGRKHGVDSAVF